VYNGARHVRHAVASVLAQAHGAIEVVVADDGSTDETPEVVHSLDSRVVYLRQANAGTAAARNLGLAHARGTYVGFLDADDRWHPEKLTRQLARFSARPELGVSFTLIRNYWSDEVAPEHRPSDPALTRPVPGYVCPTMLAHREIFERMGPFDARLRHASEPDWILRATSAGVLIEMLPEVLVDRQLHLDNASSRNAARSYDEYLHLLKAWLDRRRHGATVPGHDFGAHASAGERPLEVDGRP
jgi:glycosyltransferase involved in cell wall biosynthesis